MNRRFLIVIVVLVAGTAYFLTRGKKEPRPEAPLEAESVEAPSPQRASAPVTLPRSRPQSRPAAPTPRPGSAEARAHELLSQGKIPEAIAALREVLQQDPRSEFALLELGMLLAQDPRTRKESEGHFRKALEINPENYVALDELLSLHLDPQNPERAHQMLAEYRRSHPESPNFNAAYGRSLAAQGDIDGAISYLQRGIGGDPVLSEGVYFSLAELYKRKGDMAGAIEAYGKVVSSQEQSLNEMRTRGLPSGQLEKDILMNQVNLAEALIAARQVDEAERLLRSMSEKSPQNPTVLSLIQRLRAGR